MDGRVWVGGGWATPSRARQGTRGRPARPEVPKPPEVPDAADVGKRLDSLKNDDGRGRHGNQGAPQQKARTAMEAVDGSAELRRSVSGPSSPQRQQSLSAVQMTLGALQRAGDVQTLAKRPASSFDRKFQARRHQGHAEARAVPVKKPVRQVPNPRKKRGK